MKSEQNEIKFKFKINKKYNQRKFVYYVRIVNSLMNTVVPYNMYLSKLTKYFRKIGVV